MVLQITEKYKNNAKLGIRENCCLDSINFDKRNFSSEITSDIEISDKSETSEFSKNRLRFSGRAEKPFFNNKVIDTENYRVLFDCTIFDQDKNTHLWLSKDGSEKLSNTSFQKIISAFFISRYAILLELILQYFSIAFVMLILRYSYHIQKPFDRGKSHFENNFSYNSIR